MEMNLEISQLKILEDFFDDLSKTDQQKIFLAGFRRAAKPLIAAVKSVVPRRTGRLYRSIGSVEFRQGSSILIGSRLAGSPQNKGWHGHFTENGTRERFRRKQSLRAGAKQRGAGAGGSTGKMTAQHWFEKSYDATENQVYDNIAKAWYEEIDRFIIKTNKKAKK